jgi:hypothetical protein
MPLSFEQEIKKLLTTRYRDLVDSTESHTRLDFHIPSAGIHIEVKEKRQKFTMSHWPEVSIPQDHFFILDDLTARKLLQHAPHSYVLIRDSSVRPQMYYVYSIVDLLIIPKRRCRRPIKRNVPAFKGKWLIDLRSAAAFESAESAIDYIVGYKNKHAAIFESHIDCWGNYHDEDVIQAGIVRRASHWEKDTRKR